MAPGTVVRMEYRSVVLTVFLVSDGGLKVFIGLNANISCLEGQAPSHLQQEKVQAVMTLIMTSVVELLQSLLEVMVPLLGLVEQLVMKLSRVSGIVRMYSCPAGGLCGFWKLKCCNLSLLSCCNLSLAFFGLIMFSTKKFHFSYLKVKRSHSTTCSISE